MHKLYTMQFDGGQHVPAGLFTYAMVQQLHNIPRSATQNLLLARMSEQMRSFVQNHGAAESAQTPVLVGRRDKLLFGLEDWLGIFDFSLRRNYSAMTTDDVRQRYQDLQKELSVPFPQVHYSFGLAFLEQGRPGLALNALHTASEQSAQAFPEATLALCRAQVSTGHYKDAAGTFQRYMALVVSDSVVSTLQEVLTRLNQLWDGRKHALLVGVNEYINGELPRVRGAINDVRSLRQVLIDRYGFRPEDVKVLLDHDATHHNIRASFQDLVERAHEEPGLFYFAGNGSVRTGRSASPFVDIPTILLTTT